MRILPLAIFSIAGSRLTTANPAPNSAQPRQHVDGSLASPPNCASSSRNVTTMLLKVWDIYHAPSATAHLKGTFTILNPGTGDEYKIRAMPFLDDGFWHDCVAGADPVPKQLVACQYQLDLVPINTELDFQFQWLCADGDSKTPVLFNATIRGELSDPRDVTLTVSALSWNTSSGTVERGHS